MEGEGIKIAVFLDDGACMESSLLIAQTHAEIVRATLIAAGFVINKQKSLWEPTRILTWLGITINSISNTLCIHEKRITNLKN